MRTKVKTEIDELHIPKNRRVDQAEIDKMLASLRISPRTTRRKSSSSSNGKNRKKAPPKGILKNSSSRKSGKAKKVRIGETKVRVIERKPGATRDVKTKQKKKLPSKIEYYLGDTEDKYIRAARRRTPRYTPYEKRKR
jgi:hypothetical protein